MTGTAWTIFQGSTPEPMQVEILGVLRGARGPGQDLILARLHGAKPEYTGVVDGMSGSPVYIDGKLVGALSYRIGQFTKEPIAGITPIAQMLEVRDLSAADLAVGPPASAEARSEDAENVGDNASPSPLSDGKMIFMPMETPLVLSGFRPEAIHFSPVPPSACCWFAATLKLPPPALSPISTPGNCSPADIRSLARDRFRCP